MSPNEMSSNSEMDAAQASAASAPAAVPAEETPKKRTVRRTRKASTADAADAAASEASAAPAASEAPAASDAPAEAKPKRRPGRPRKVRAEEAPADTAAQIDAAATAEASAEAKPKRKPGRPRKSATKATPETPVVPTEAPQDAPAPEAEEAPAEEPRKSDEPRKRPGRSTKLRAMVEASEASEPDTASGDAASEAPAASDAPAEAKPKRRPGRPRKSVAVHAAREEAVEVAEASDAPASHDAVEGAQSEEGETAQRRPRRSREERESKGDSYAKSDRYEKRNRADRQDRQDRQDRLDRLDRQDRQNQRDRRAANKQQNGKQQNHADQHAQRRQRRQHNGREPIAPKTTMDDLAKLKVAELRAKAAELNVDATGLKKAELVAKVFEASVRAEGFIEVEGVLDIMQDGYGFLRTKGYLPSENDVYVGLATIRRNNLRKGDMVAGQTRPKRDNEKYAALQQVNTVNGIPVDQLGQRVRFGDLTPVFPDECLTMEHGRSTITARVIDLVSPIGKGQRGLIVSPPKAGKTTVLKDIAAAITANNPEVHLMCLLVDERPEEVTDMQRSIKGEVIASTFDMPTENHIAVSELVIERAKRLVELGEDVVVLLDSLTRLARAYNLAQPASGRILSGGVDSTALYPPKRFLGAARNIEGGGSLTILASALIETGSKMDEVIFEEFKGTGNMELKLDRTLADRRVFPAIDPVASGTRREDLLLNPQEAPLIWAVRRILANMNSTERAMDMLIKSLKQTNNNQEFLLRTAKKAQSQRDSENMEL